MQRKDGSSGTMDPIRQENVRDRPVEALVTPLTKTRNPGAKKAARRKRKALQKRGLWIEPGQARATTVGSENATTPTVVTNESNLGRDGDEDMGAQEHITPEREDDNERVKVKDGVMEIGNEVDRINNADEESVDRAIDTLFKQLGRSAVVRNRITAPFSADQLEDLRAESLQMLTEAHMAGEVPNSNRGSWGSRLKIWLLFRSLYHIP
jgi:hypothetical protein